jgi:hypothetical protein
MPLPTIRYLTYPKNVEDKFDIFLYEYGTVGINYNTVVKNTTQTHWTYC